MNISIRKLSSDPTPWHSISGGPRLDPVAPPPALAIRLQPIFHADGAVLEYAVVSRPVLAAKEGPGRDLWTTVAFLRRHSEDLRLSIDWSESYANGPDLAQRLRARLDVNVLGHQDRIRPARLMCKDTEMALLGETFTFTVPMDQTLTPSRALLHGFPNFKIRLKGRIAPLHKQGASSGNSELRITGLRIVLPPNAAESPAAQGRFCSLVELARAKKLQVHVCEINQIADMAWLRSFGDVVLQGDALCRPLSCDLLDEWWSRDPDWREFSIGR